MADLCASVCPGGIDGLVAVGVGSEGYIFVPHPIHPQSHLAMTISFREKENTCACGDAAFEHAWDGVVKT